MEAAVFASLTAIGTGLGLSTGLFWGIFAIVALWTLVLKGFALWHAARNYQRYWFVAIIVINTFGILELIYLTWFRKDRDEARTQSLFSTPEGVSSSEA